MSVYSASEAMLRCVVRTLNAAFHNADWQILGAASTIGKTLSKAVYVFSPDEETGKVAHLNYLPKDILSSKKLDAKIWLGEVSKIIGGKVCPLYLQPRHLLQVGVLIYYRVVEGMIAPLGSVVRGTRSTRPWRKHDGYTKPEWRLRLVTIDFAGKCSIIVNSYMIE